MANVVPRREPCVKCNNPVFFAERLVINESLYHRTCFRCARCSSVLTLGNFYETEKDHEFCCETCPDEEKPSFKVETSNRLSIAQRVALFERESSSVLKKSLSDEEKSKSLSRQKPANSKAFNKFLDTQVTTQKGEVSEEDDKTAESLSSDSESEDEAPPLVPLNHPEKTLISDKKVEISDHKVISEAPQNFVVTKELTNDTATKAIAEATETHSESHDMQAPAVILFDRKMSEISQDDDEIDSLFEKLAEDAVNSPTVSIPIVTKKFQVPAIKIEETKPEEDKVGKVEEVKKEEEEKVEFEEVEQVKPQEDVKIVIPVVEPEIDEVSVETKEEIPEQAAVVPEPEPVTQPPETIESLPAVIENDQPQEKLKEEEEEVYPEDLDPFGDDDKDEEKEKISKPEPPKKQSLNPFGSDDEEEETQGAVKSFGTLPKPPRPPPPKTIVKPISTNPFGSDDEGEENETELHPIRTPVPTPRKPFLHSATPEPSPRSISNHNSPGHSFKGSTSSLASSSDGMSLRRKKKKAPAPPPSGLLVNGVIDTPNAGKTPSTTPKKKRPAPTPPSSTPRPVTLNEQSTPTTLEFQSETISDINGTSNTFDSSNEFMSTSTEVTQEGRRLIPLEESLIEEGSSPKHSQSDEPVTYRRKIVPLSPQSTEERNFGENVGQSKDNKEAQNRQRQSQSSLMTMKAGSESSDSLPYLNKSSHGKWKRRKGPAPALPGYAQPQRRILQMLPLQEIRQELEVIEVQQQGLEKQGVMLEKMIRERCEGSADNRTTEELLETLPPTKNPKEVEELILQLFELVNEKNELFRRQAELMYLRRAHRLEEEQADVEYEIRTLMAQPEQNKTDTDKAKEEALIARLVEIVQLRNEVVDTLDRDRLREAEEDLSIKQRMESHTAKLDQDYLNQTPTKLSKKEKKKLKEAKKLKNKKLDADKDLDTKEVNPETSEKKKKKKKFLFGGGFSSSSSKIEN